MKKLNIKLVPVWLTLAIVLMVGCTQDSSEISKNYELSETQVEVNFNLLTSTDFISTRANSSVGNACFIRSIPKGVFYLFKDDSNKGRDHAVLVDIINVDEIDNLIFKISIYRDKERSIRYFGAFVFGPYPLAINPENTATFEINKTKYEEFVRCGETSIDDYFAYVGQDHIIDVSTSETVDICSFMSEVVLENKVYSSLPLYGECEPFIIPSVSQTTSSDISSVIHIGHPLSFLGFNLDNNEGIIESVYIYGGWTTNQTDRRRPENMNFNIVSTAKSNNSSFYANHTFEDYLKVEGTNLKTVLFSKPFVDIPSYKASDTQLYQSNTVTVIFKTHRDLLPGYAQNSADPSPQYRYFAYEINKFGRSSILMFQNKDVLFDGFGQFTLEDAFKSVYHESGTSFTNLEKYLYTVKLGNNYALGVKQHEFKDIEDGYALEVYFNTTSKIMSNLSFSWGKGSSSPFALIDPIGKDMLSENKFEPIINKINTSQGPAEDILTIYYDGFKCFEINVQMN